ISSNKKQSDGQDGSNHGDVDPDAICGSASSGTIDISSALDPFRSQFEGPGQNQSNRKPKQSQRYHRGRDCIRKMKSGNDCRCDLHDQPADDCVSHRDFINVPPLELGKEIARLHSFTPSKLAFRGLVTGASAFAPATPATLPPLRAGSRPPVFMPTFSATPSIYEQGRHLLDRINKINRI